jgi:hypothetical protein
VRDGAEMRESAQHRQVSLRQLLFLSIVCVHCCLMCPMCHLRYCPKNPGEGTFFDWPCSSDLEKLKLNYDINTARLLTADCMLTGILRWRPISILQDFPWESSCWGWVCSHRNP